VIVRSDAPPGVQAAQIVHAAGSEASRVRRRPSGEDPKASRLEKAQLVGASSASPPTVAVVLAASPEQLAALARALLEEDLPHVLVREPDEPWRGALMAIGVVPAHRERVRRTVAHLRPLHAAERSRS
jgi:hypothetical protein